MSKIYLPLRLWAMVAVMVSTSTILLSHDWKLGESQEQKSKILNLTRLQQKTHKYHIVALGNSLLACAMPFDRAIEAQLERQSIETKIDRITISGMYSEYFMSILPKILNSKPNLIILEAELFLFDFSEQQKSQLGMVMQKNISDFHAIIRADSNNDYHQNRSENRKIFQIGCKNQFIDRANLDTKARSVYKNPRIDTRLNAYLPFIQQAQKLGIKIVFLEMGRSKVGNDYLGQDAQNTINDLLSTIATRTNAEVWRFPANLPLEYYCDLAHLNHRGEKVFTEWLIEKLKTKL
jgi:hypothetical protein